MTDPTAAWSENESAIYRGLSRYAVPEREHQIAIITSLVGAAAVPGPVLDLCCGEGLLTSALLREFPAASVHAYDGSKSMLETTRQHAGSRDRLVTRDIDLGATDWRQPGRGWRAIVSSLAVHHLDDAGKRALFVDLNAMLAPGGVFVLADVIRPATPVGNVIAADGWDAAVRQRALTLDGTLAGYEAFRRADWNHFRHDQPDPIDKPSTLVAHLDWLRAAGFADVDVHWMTAGQMILSGWKR